MQPGCAFRGLPAVVSHCHAPWSGSRLEGGCTMNEHEKFLAILRQSADADIVDAIERLIQDAPDHELNRLNALAFAAKHGFDEDGVIGAFLHASRLGLFEMSWNVL